MASPVDCAKSHKRIFNFSDTSEIEMMYVSENYRNYFKTLYVSSRIVLLEVREIFEKFTYLIFDQSFIYQFFLFRLI